MDKKRLQVGFIYLSLAGNPWVIQHEEEEGYFVGINVRSKVGRRVFEVGVFDKEGYHMTSNLRLDTSQCFRLQDMDILNSFKPVKNLLVKVEDQLDIGKEALSGQTR